MSLVSDLRSMEVPHVMLSVGAFLATVAPGVAIIYHFRPDLFEKYDVVKLILLSVAFTLPVFLPHFLVVMFVVLCPVMLVTIFAFALSSIVLYSALCLAYLFSLNFFMFLVTIAVAEFLLLLLVCILVPWVRYSPLLGLALAHDQLKEWKEEAKKESASG